MMSTRHFTLHLLFCQGNKCAIFRANSIGPEGALDSTVYKFGDMLLKPSLRNLRRVINLSNLKLNPALYTEYRLRRKSQVKFQSQGRGQVAIGSGGGGGASRSTLTLENVDETEVWGLFFEDICSLGVSLCQHTFHLTGMESYSNRDSTSLKEAKEENAWISLDDIDLQEPFLFIGLPACALFMTIFRSFTDSDGIVLMDASRIVTDTCPDTFKEMFDMLMVTKSSLMDIELKGDEDSQLQQNDFLWMQQFLLYSSSDQEITITPESGGPSLERQTQFRHALSHLVGVCIQLTQQTYFKENFLSVLEEISNRITSV